MKGEVAMERYYQNPERTALHRLSLVNYEFVTVEQLRDICALLKEGGLPDDSFTTGEHRVWELLVDEFPVRP
jgi:hypothetical protein